MAPCLMFWPSAHTARSDRTAVSNASRFSEEHYFWESSQPKSSGGGNVTLTTGNLAWSDMGSNRGLWGEKRATNRFFGNGVYQLFIPAEHVTYQNQPQISDY